MTETLAYRTEETPELLIGYSGNEHLSAATYESFLGRWAERLAQGRRFGVVLVYEAHEHDEDEGRDADEEDRMTRALGDFRRAYREASNRLTTGFAQVFDASLADGLSERDVAQHQARSSGLAEYLFGARGKDFTDLADAQAWLATIAEEGPLPLTQRPSGGAADGIGFYYGSTTGTTERVAEKMQAFAARVGLELNPINIGNLKDPQDLLAYDQLILGIPTWNVGQLQDDWLLLVPELGALDFRGKHVALFGVGDQKDYPENFLDALGMLGHKLLERGATLVGSWSTEGYDFTASRAQVGSEFMGLGLDEDNQAELTDSRIATWLGVVYKAFAEARLEPVG